MANFIKSYNNEPFVGHLLAPTTSSVIYYRPGLTFLLRVLKIRSIKK